MPKHSTLVNYLCLLVISVAGLWGIWSMLSLSTIQKDSQFLNRYMKVYVDPTNTLGIDDVSSPSRQHEFVQQSGTTLNFGFTQSTIWARIDLPHLRDDVESKEWFLEVGRARMDITELWESLPDGTLEHYVPAHEQRINEYQLRYSNPTFVVETRRDEVHTYFLKLKNRTAFFVPIVLWEPNAFLTQATVSQFLFGIFYGGMLVMFFYNLFVWFVVRDISYLYYVGYIGSATIFQFTDFGRGYDLLGPVAGALEKAHIPLLIWMTWVFGLLFGRRFLELHARHPVLDRIVITLIIIAIINGSLSYTMDYHDSQMAAVVFSMIFLLFVPYMGIYCYFKGNDNALFFNIAWICNIAGYFIYSTVTTGIASANTFLVASMPIGTLLEVALLSFALGHRIKQLERATLAARQRSMRHLSRFRSLFDNAIEGIYQMSLAGHITSANRSMYQTLGYASEHDLQQDSPRIRRQLFPTPAQQFAQLSRIGRLTEEREFTRADGDPIEAIHFVQLIRKKNGQPSHFEGTFVNITERRERDRAEKDRLREKRERELAEEATAQKSDFLKKMSYEIRMPLTSIMGFSEALRTTRMSPTEKSECVESVLVSSQSLLSLINDILDYSKIEAGKMPVEQINTDLFILLEKVQAMVQRQTSRRGLHFEIQHAFPLPREVRIDPTRLRQTLENLCYYAVDATPQGQVSMNVSWDTVDNCLRFIVQDNSLGMSEKEAAMLFEVFAHNASGSRRQTGSGLGLVIARQLAILMGGSLEVIARPRQPTQFILKVAAEAPDRKLWITSTTPTIATPAATTRKGQAPQLRGKVLVAEDNTVNQQLIQRVIRKTGAMVTIAVDGQVALDELAAQRFDLVLMDVNMPVMGGLEATQTLRRSGYAGPIFALTAEQGAEEIQACLVAGCDGHLAKPLDLDKFYAVLSQHLPAAGHDATETGLHSTYKA